ncbi:phosphate ABC transporter, permease protein PstA [candidate division WOR-1 bacterium RIFOXYA12_FULL_43_27]|uniref:Phosphate transport system permease protein PstA n=1 Tax=candidate division WOR-1 bacterium RIFOXYC2_FULL_46_14 TaxID=1802587 RepID=A0A1F4U547_UNCSA|nr:MAG: phosphate ABC transporter, permease protein PstA [candidate division WOR-1 bacterium RIFOXYA12_FULL_43_27]OGC20681.1 MAG: phosphate ABC transporter, permease protein PstA [candidate division WOR-1 bacterium RIFOXYB2_FULL_46_45]OGC31582.1 MAG: phosphate ABC transporter, permease protein PstA [candidate division WOR-1 bacterium RIFOXYA2_FULL_46_56]OGC39987.1 MAG: phosphate ABC transporter, permease protein PstA [candidate division WOR-1 bacterium RIFOXYC2_FULL_46_14]
MENNTEIQSKLRKIKERFFLAAVVLCALIAVVPLFSVIGYVFIKGISAVNLDFFTKLPVPVGDIGGGMGNAIVGTFILSGIACLVGLPVGIFGGIWLAQFGKGKRGFFIRYSADVLSSIPTIVIGIFAYVLLVATLKHFSAVAGGFALGIIMIPTVTRTTEEMVKMVPRNLYEAGLALGIPEWKVTLHIVFRTAWNGIFTGVMLSVARIMGETAPLIFTAFNTPYWSLRVDQPMASMTVTIYNYAISPFAEWHAQAWAGSLTLVFIVLSITLLVRKFSKRVVYT